MNRTIPLLLVSFLSYGSMLSVGAQRVTKQQSPQQKTKPAAPRIIRPALLGDGFAVLPPPEFERFSKNADKMKKISEADTNAMKSSVDSWAASLQAATNKYDSNQCKLAIVMFVPQLDSVWDKDQFISAKLEQYAKRVKTLSPEVIDIWKSELYKITSPLGGGVSDLNTIGFLIQLDRLFPDDQFRKDQSEALLARLRTLSSEAVKTLKEAIKSNANQAAVILIQNDSLFIQNQFQETSFNKAALDALVTALGNSK